MSKAQILEVNGEPAVVADGKVYPPMTITLLQSTHPEYLRKLGEAGLRIFYIMVNAVWLEEGEQAPDRDPAVSRFVRIAEDLLREVPEAKIMIRVYLAPDAEWCDKYPDDLMRFNDGSVQPVNVRGTDYCGMYCIGSDRWRRDAAYTLKCFMEKIDRTSQSHAVIGYFLGAGGSSEWYHGNALTDFARKKYAGFSPAFRTRYVEFLTKKYGTDDALRKAWKREDVSLADPPIPNWEEREFIVADDKYIAALERQNFLLRPEDADPFADLALGIILNPDRNQMLVDFYLTWHHATAGSVLHLAAVIRERYGKTKLVGAFYGAWGSTAFHDFGTAAAVLPILDSGLVDFLAAPGTYTNRQPGGYIGQREMMDSFRLRNMIFIAEDDERTYINTDFYRDLMEQYTVQDSLKVLKREFGRNICQETQSWWFDMSGQPEWEKSSSGSQTRARGWYEDPEILALFKRQQEIAEYAYSLPRKKRNEIACIVDQESILYVSDYLNTSLLDHYRGTDWSRIGAGMDYYFHDDMDNPDMPDYKLYFVVNAFALSRSERRTMKEKFARNGASAIFLYAPGIIMTDADDRRMSLDHISDLIGMNVSMFNGTHSPCYRLEEEKREFLPFGDFDRTYGFLDRGLKSNISLAQMKMPPFMNPGFFIDDPDAVVLGRYRIDGKPALAMKKQPEGWTSIYSAPQFMRSELIAGFAQMAGCHLYVHTDDCLYASRNFVTIHAAFTGNRRLCFPAPCDPFEVYEKKFYGKNVREITLNLRKGETKMFCLAGRVP